MRVWSLEFNPTMGGSVWVSAIISLKAMKRLQERQPDAPTKGLLWDIAPRRDYYACIAKGHRFVSKILFLMKECF